MSKRRFLRVKEITCSHCDGTGITEARDEDDICENRTCHYCMGQGYIEDERDEITGYRIVTIQD